MAEEKKSYIMYKSWNPLLESLPPEQLYEVFHAIIKYQNGEETNIKDPVIQAIFKMFKKQFEEDENKWGKERQQRIDAGRKGGKAKPTEYKECLAEVSEAKECLAPLSKVKQTQANQAVMVEVEGNVEVEDSVDVKNILPPYSPPKGGKADSSLRSESRENVSVYTPPKTDRTDYQAVLDAFHESCSSLPKVLKLSDSRKKAIKARLNDFGLEEIKRAFVLTEQSDFLKGTNTNGWQASFDWLMKPANLTKVLEGNYENRASPGKKSMWGEDDYLNKLANGEVSLSDDLLVGEVIEEVEV